MKRTAIIIAVVAATALAACGGDDSSSISGVQAEAAQAAVDSAAESGVTLDRDCVDKVAAQLSDEDAALAAEDGDQELSPEGEALSADLIACADQDELIDSLVAGMGEGVDQECAKEALSGLDLATMMAAAGDEPPAELVEALTPCFGG
jgi:hypothetical protein